MKLKVLSASSMDSYESCSKKYYYAKESGIKRKDSTGYLVGLCFHQAMEMYVKQRYRYSFSQCTRHANKTVGFDHYNDTIVNETIGIGEAWLQEHKMPEPLNIESPSGPIKYPMAEMAFGPPGHVIYDTPVMPANAVTFSSGLKVHGMIDMIHPEYDRFGNCTMVITDWKTNKWPPETISDKRQPQLYVLVVHKLTNLPVRCEFWYVRDPYSGPRVFQPSLEDLQDIEERLLDVQARIAGDTNAEATPTIDCQWCGYNYACPDFTQWLDQTPANGKPQSWDTMDLDALADIFGFYRDRHLASDKARKEIQKIILSRMHQGGLKELNEWQIAYRYQTEWSPHGQDVIQEWGGLDIMPTDLKTQLIQHHKLRDIGSPFLRPKRK